MKFTQPKLIGSFAAIVLSTFAASAQTTYLDASFNANTFLAPSAGGGAIATNNTDTVDGIWRHRGNLGVAPSVTTPPSGTISLTGGTVYESTGNTTPADNVPRVVTSVSGLSLNTYDVFLYFWSDSTGAPWRIGAGLTDDVAPLSVYQVGTAGVVQLAVDTSNRKFMQASLGQVTGTSIDVFVEDSPGANGNTRTWYDGIGYAVAVVPEPSSFALMGFAALGLLMKRKLKA